MFLPGLKASTSRQTIQRAIPSRTYLPNRNPYGLISTAHRYASTSSSLTEDLTAHQKRQLAGQERQAKMMPRLDMSRLMTPILEPFIDQSIKYSWFLRIPDKRMYEYCKQRVFRWWTTRQQLDRLVKQGAIGKYTGSTIGWRISRKGGPMLVDALELYKSYNQAQAAGNVSVIRSTCTGNVLESALAIAKSIEQSRRPLTWEYLRSRKSPKIVSVRFGAIDPSATKVAAQIVVKFDTDQALTTIPRQGKPVRKASRVIEHIVFEKRIPGDSTWKIKDKVEPTPPGFLEKEKELEKI